MNDLFRISSFGVDIVEVMPDRDKVRAVKRAYVEYERGRIDLRRLRIRVLQIKYANTVEESK